LLDGYQDLSEPRQKFFIYDMRGWLENELLIRADKITMAHSLESRVPFLDHELVELCLQIPSSLKMEANQTKAVLRKAMSQSLPPATTGRRQHGFVVPISDWIRTDWRELIADFSRDSSSRSRGIFDMNRVDEMLVEHCDGKADWMGPLFGFLLTEIWHREFIDA
jgi:asparagine synthase (glutamine-hydrolysing)